MCCGQGGDGTKPKLLRQGPVLSGLCPKFVVSLPPSVIDGL